MSYQERVIKVIDNMDLGEPIFDVSVSGMYLELEAKDWESNLNDKDIIEQFVNRYARRSFDVKARKYTVNKDDVVQSIGNYVVSNMTNVFEKCSPYDAPRRTKVYKGFCNVVNENHSHPEFRKSMFDIYEYYFNSTQTDSITKPGNDVHRKNIYQLLCLMEKRYGKKTGN